MSAECWMHYAEGTEDTVILAESFCAEVLSRVLLIPQGANAAMWDMQSRVENALLDRFSRALTASLLWLLHLVLFTLSTTDFWPSVNLHMVSLFYATRPLASNSVALCRSIHFSNQTLLSAISEYVCGQSKERGLDSVDGIQYGGSCINKHHLGPLTSFHSNKCVHFRCPFP